MNASYESGYRPVLWVDEDYDRENASDRRSRFGSYLVLGSHKFAEETFRCSDRADFALAVFTTACSPVMSPGYVRTDQRVSEVSWFWGEDDRPAVDLELVAPHPASVARALDTGRWRGWQSLGFGDDRQWFEPDCAPSAFTTLTLRVPLVASRLPDPAFEGRVPVLSVAKDAVASVCQQVNAYAGGVLAAVEGASR